MASGVFKKHLWCHFFQIQLFIIKEQIKNDNEYKKNRKRK